MLDSVGLGGDGDEIDAVEKAFARFGVPVPYDDAPTWVTVGDLWASLLCLLLRAAKQPDAFLRFCRDLCDEPGIDPHLIDENSRLIL